MQTYDAKKEKKTWALKDVIFLAVIGIFFGIIYQVWSYAYYAMAATPLKPFANDATLGVWIMAGPLAGVLIQKIGSSVIGEMLAAAVEMLLFSSWGASTLISGFVQGIGSEPVIAIGASAVCSFRRCLRRSSLLYGILPSQDTWNIICRS